MTRKQSERLQSAIASTILIVGALILIQVTGCVDDDAAPIAPDLAGDVPACALEQHGCDYGDATTASSPNKHGWTHASRAVQTLAAPGTYGLSDQCNDRPGDWSYAFSCWWKTREYGTRNIYYNDSSVTWWFASIRWEFCFDQLRTTSAQQWIANRSAYVCIDGHCVDVTNRHSGQTNGCRYGTLYEGDLPLVISPGQYKHVDVLVTLRDGWISNPARWPSTGLGSLSYWD